MVESAVRAPAPWKRVWAALLVGVAQLPMLWFDDKAADEDALVVVDGGPDKWYPIASRPVRPPRSLWYRVVGRGLGIRGTLTYSGTELRFMPTSFWRNRGFGDFIVTEPRLERRGGFVIAVSGGATAVFRSKLVPGVV